MTPAAYRRGQPVMTLVVVLTAWIAMRVLTWNLSLESGAEMSGAVAAPARVAPLPMAQVRGDDTVGQAYVPASWQQRLYHPDAALGEAPPAERMGAVSEDRLREVPSGSVPEHPAPPVPYISPDTQRQDRRWSADGWMMLRDGGGFSPVAGPRATYGASQLGAVLRYRLASESGHRPTAYFRGTAALVRPHDREVAAGLSVRPIPGIPLTVAAELRGGEINSATRVRPAIMAVTELPPQKLPLDLLAEAYAQAGYVGGTGATGFIDGQLRVDAAIARLGRAELRMGGGAWGGAQKDASRFDLGPAVNLGVSVSDTVFARLMVDWRFRVAGNAVPESGPALTLSAGF